MTTCVTSSCTSGLFQCFAPLTSNLSKTRSSGFSVHSGEVSVMRWVSTRGHNRNSRSPISWASNSSWPVNRTATYLSNEWYKRSRRHTLTVEEQTEQLHVSLISMSAQHLRTSSPIQIKVFTTLNFGSWRTHRTAKPIEKENSSLCKPTAWTKEGVVTLERLLVKVWMKNATWYFL